MLRRDLTCRRTTSCDRRRQRPAAIDHQAAIELRARRRAIINDDPFAPRRRRSRPGRDYRIGRQGLAACRARSIYDFGAAELTSITAYRYNKFDPRPDADYNNLDILYPRRRRRRYNRFKTFTQELRLQGNAFERPARLAGRRLLRERETDAFATISLTARIMRLRQLPVASTSRSACIASASGSIALGTTCVSPASPAADCLAGAASGAMSDCSPASPLGVLPRLHQTAPFNRPPFGTAASPI